MHIAVGIHLALHMEAIHAPQPAIGIYLFRRTWQGG